MRHIICVLLFINVSFTYAQEDPAPKWLVNGYVKYLHAYFLIPDFDQQISDQLIHNRVNIKYFPHANWTFKVDFRNRLFYGENVKLTPEFNELVTDVNNDYLDLSVTLSKSKSHVLHSMIDRAYVEYSKDNWEIRLGRQRINWGIQSFWNPHDVFNVYSFTDFDYEERPGSDALLVRYYTGVASSVEFAVKAADHIQHGTIAGLWKFNKWNYDFQWAFGYFQENLMTGIGWAGNIKNAGFKGEWAYFGGLDEEKSSFLGSLGLDYVFSNSWYGSIGMMYNSLGTTDDPVSNLFDFELSAKNLYPYESAVFVTLGIPVTPLTNANVSIIYSPVTSHPMFISPGVTFSVASNWDLDLIGQILFNKADRFYSPVQALFMRIKYSY